MSEPDLNGTSGYGNSPGSVANAIDVVNQTVAATGDDAAALAQAAANGAATLVDGAPEHANQTLQDAEALKNEALWAASDAAMDAYNEALSRWPKYVPRVEVVGYGVGGQAMAKPPINSAGHDGTHPKPPPEPDAPVDRAVNETVQRLAGPRGPDNETRPDDDSAPDLREDEPEAPESRQAGSPQAAPAPSSQGQPPLGGPPDRGETPLAPATEQATIPSLGPGIGFAVAATTLATFAFGAWLLSRTRIVGRILAGLPFARLFSRQTGQDVLKHPARARVHSVISQYPGITLKVLAEATGIRASTLRYHLEVLRREELVHVVRGAKIHHFHPAGADPQEKAAQCLFLKHRGLLAKIILGKPGASQQRLAQELGVSPSRVCTYVRDLTRGGLVRAQRMGRYQRYFPTQLLEGIQEHGRIPES